jgi:hypothetical protein
VPNEYDPGRNELKYIPHFIRTHYNSARLLLVTFSVQTGKLKSKQQARMVVSIRSILGAGDDPRFTIVRDQVLPSHYLSALKPRSGSS